MSRNGYQGPKLPKFLLDKVENDTDSRFNNTSVGRKARRKAERQQKKQDKNVRKPETRRPIRHSEAEDDVSEDENTLVPAKPTSAGSSETTRPLKSILKPTKPSQAVAENREDDDGRDPTIRRRAKQRLKEDDAEIAALEKKLGVKGKKSKALEEDGLNWIAGGGSDSEDSEGRSSNKRKRPEDVKWLRDKRLKAGDPDESGSEDDDEEEIENPFSDDELHDNDFDGLDSEGDSEVEDEVVRLPTAKKQKENPYLPPVTGASTPAAKYVPPSLRTPAAEEEDEEVLKQLRRQIQGLLNRLAESNLISILRSLEELYTRNPRQHVTATLIDILVGLVADAAVLNDTFLVLHAGFAAAVYKLVGTDFGAQLLERLVQKIDHFYSASGSEGKQALNLLAFLCNLYIFQLVGSPIIFDYIRLLLAELSENNTELLLRVIRTCGQTLRQDDPSALKDVVLLLQRSVAKAGEAHVSVRTKFMIETINDLKNNRMKAASSTTLTAEQTTRIKKTLLSLKNSRSLKPTEPLSINLADIRNSDKKGKWWLVGASYTPTTNPPNPISNDDSDSDLSHSEPGTDLNALAKQQGMNTAVRRSIFTTLLSSVDYQHAHTQLLKLHLKNRQQLEIPRVLIHCVKAEEAYNPFYALVAAKFCADRALRKGFEFGVWDFFRQMEDAEAGVGMRQIVNVSKFCGTLVAEQAFRMTLLEKLEFAPLEGKGEMFLEVFLTTLFTAAKRPVGGKKVSDEEFESTIRSVFQQVAGDAVVVRGLREVLEESVGKGDLAVGKKEKKAVERACEIALGALEQAAGKIATVEEDESDDDEMY